VKARLVGAVLLAATLSAADRVPAERVVSGAGLIAVSVNGHAATLRVDPAAPGLPLIDVETARAAGLKLDARVAGRVGYLVGTTVVTARTQVTRVDLGAGPSRRRVGWTDRPFALVADGTVGPEALPEPVVRFQLRAAMQGERTISIPMDRDTLLLGMGHFGATFGRVEVDGAPMRVRFDPYHARSLVTAGAGARLARVYDGVISGAVVPTDIFFGVRRPVRTLTLRRPFRLGVLAITTLGIRTADQGSAGGIREATAVESQGDPDEVVVTARGSKRPSRHDTMSIGADHLSRCSAVVFDRRAQLIRLMCA
jgi:hypothetical protein